MLLLAEYHAASAGVVINEIMAAASDRRISWDTNGAPRLGSGARWMDSDYTVAGWSQGTLPAGYGFSGLATNILSLMKDKAYALYVRKQFAVAADYLNLTNQLALSMQYNDGFVAYLNGREIARANCGPTNHFMFSSQPAYNVNTAPGPTDFLVGTAAARLRSGLNVLAIQAHNADDPNNISSHIPTTEFRINAGLRILGGSNLPADIQLVALGPEGGAWRFFVGRVEPSGGVSDIGLVNRVFTPPTGEEGDFENPAEFADWIELYNGNANPVDLSGWSLSDDKDVPGRWHFPTNTSIPGWGYLLVMCDDRNEANGPLGPATRLHTNFKLDAAGEKLALYDANGAWVDGFPLGYPPQTFSCSYGRTPANPAEFAYMSLATPGAVNSRFTLAGRVNPPEFRNPTGQELLGGLYPNQPLTLHLSCTTPNATIRYTLAGGDPSLTGIDYTKPLTLSQTYEKVGLVVRAQAFLPGWIPSEVVTHTYLLGQPSLLTSNPVLLMSGTPGRSFYTPEGVLAIAGGRWTDSIWYTSGPNSYNMVLGSGYAFEREVNLEYYFPSNYYKPGQKPFRTGAGVRISASPWQRPRMVLNQAASASPWPVTDTTQKPSFNVYFAGDYSSGALSYDLFTNSTVHEYRHLRLRAGKNDNYNPFITDEIMRRLWLDLGQVGSRGLFCSLYVNGIYKGVYNLCERLREPFFQAHYQNDAEWDVCYSHDWVNGDGTAYQKLITYLDRDLNIALNWSNVTNSIDIDNAADYYLLNIYAATWDWPGNNFALARARVTGPEGRFRFAVWDAEGGFQAVTYAKPVYYNTITQDLMPSSTLPVARIFKRLVSSLEFRLRFADNVNLRMFNGGVLDDRDPDGSGPLKSRFRERLDALVAEAGNLVRYNTSQGISTSPFLAWMSTTSGRRSYLLGSTAGRKMLRDASLWPATEPPVFSQHGGEVPPGYLLSITSSVATSGQTAVVYYTTNGTDPRLLGGTLSTNAISYDRGVPIEGVVTIYARARNRTTSEWSPLTFATFATASVPASSTNLVIAEIMYHPPSETAAELAAGFQNADDFEFVRLQNIGSAPIDLRGARFTQGIAFDFNTSAIRYLAPGQNVLLTKNTAAFRARYGTAALSMIAGEYDGNLANGGERLVLVDTNNAVMRSFSYSDQSPWPETPDGHGSSLLLRQPGSNPNHALAENWVASAAPGGMPAGIPNSLGYAGWRSFFWEGSAATNTVVAGPSADPDGDGVPNYVEYATGSDPLTPSPAPRIGAKWESDSGISRIVILIQANPGARDASIVWQTRDQSGTWQDTGEFDLIDATACEDGTEIRRYVESEPDSTGGGRLLRAAYRW
jgi:hypothetical protein